MRTWTALLVALAGAVILAVFATTPPKPQPASAPPSVFSAGRAMADIRVIGQAPHFAGTPQHARLRAYLIARLRQLGLQVSTTTSALDAQGRKAVVKQAGPVAAFPPIVNIVATLPGRDPRLPALLLMAHYDSVFGSPAAADDGAGVASILETLRAIRADGPPPRDLMVVLSDGEELGLEGAKAFFGNNPRAAHVGVMINLETRGGGGRASMFETGADNGAMMQLFARSVKRPVATSLSVFIYQHLPNSTDYTIAKRRGLPGFNFAFIGRPAQYHSPMATPAALDQGALQDMGQQALALARGLLAVPVLPGKGPDRVFFDAFGLFLVSYAAWVGWLILVIGAIGYGVAACRRATIGEMLRGAGAQIALFVLAALLLFAVNWVSGGYGKVNYYDRLAAIPRLEVQALAVCLAALALMRSWALRPMVGAVTGAALPLLALAILAQIAAPTAAYPIAVPLLLGGLAALIGRTAPRFGTIANIVAAMLVVGYMLGFGFFLLEAVGPGMPMIAALPLVISALLLMPLAGQVERKSARIAAVVLLAVAIGIALWVRLDALAPSVAVYSTSNGVH